jgi:hypothetical protein
MEFFERESKRKFVTDEKKYTRFQVSYNSFNHFMFRWFNPDEPDKDVVIVLDSAETSELFRFLSKLLGLARELRGSDC